MNTAISITIISIILPSRGSSAFDSMGDKDDVDGMSLHIQVEILKRRNPIHLLVRRHIAFGNVYDHLPITDSIT